MNKNCERFLIDANTIITPYNHYYPFDLAPIFWQLLKENVEDERIMILT